MLATQNIGAELTQVIGRHSVLIVPGLDNSDAQHWQSLWQKQLPRSKRIELDDWTTPDLEKWCNAIELILNASKTPLILIAHSFGALASARIAGQFPEKIAGLLLVAPADPDKFFLADQLPRKVLAVKTQVIASTNDPWMQVEKAAHWASLWGAKFLPIENLGHINSASNLGTWPKGIEQLRTLIHSD
ncbi:MAG TPA: alpha/beta hydrolase [Cellvibrionaceae bacterium]